MNWGKKILFFYLFFVAGILFLVVKSMNQQQDLVTNEYYDQELKFQQKIDESKRADSIENAVIAKYFKDTVSLFFSDAVSKNDITGSILIYCPNDEKKDVKQEFKMLSNNRTINIPYFSKGFRRLKINWTSDSKTYYKELDLFLKD